MPGVMTDALTLGQAADHFGVQMWALRRLFVRGRLAMPPKFGREWVIERTRLPEIGAALAEAGLVPPARKKGG